MTKLSKNTQVPQCDKTAVMQSVMENIKVQENYFYKLDNLKEVKIIWKKYDKANILEIGIEYPTAIVDLDRLLGIPITNEWLLRFGFINNGFCYKLEDFKIFIHANKDFQFTVVYKDLDVSKNIKYLHKLQNLYFSLTGRELTVA